jgi:hypothetical protein
MTEADGTRNPDEGKTADSLRETDISPYLEYLLQEASDPDAMIARLERMADLLDTDPDLRELLLPVHILVEAMDRQLTVDPTVFDEEKSLEEWFGGCCEDVLRKAVNEGIIERFSKSLFSAFQRSASFDDRCSIVAANEYMHMHDNQPAEHEFRANPLWGFFFWRTALNTIAILDQVKSGKLNEKDAAAILFSSVAEEEEEEAEEDEGEDPLSQALKTVYDGIEMGYFSEHLPFHWIVRIPFSLDVLAGNENAALPDDKRTPDRASLSGEVLASAAQEGAANGVVDELRAICRRALEGSPSPGVELTYSALRSVLDGFDPEECPVLPAIYYEHYLHYLLNGSEEHREAVAGIYEEPQNPERYRLYAHALKTAGEDEAARRVDRVRAEIEEWRAL